MLPGPRNGLCLANKMFNSSSAFLFPRPRGYMQPRGETRALSFGLKGEIVMAEVGNLLATGGVVRPLWDSEQGESRL